MAKLVSSLITSLDGFAAGPNGELDMFNVGAEFFDFSNTLTDQAGTALYGRGTFQLMDSYWPNAAQNPDASKHDIEHSAWYNRVEKIVLSTTLKNLNKPNTRVIDTNLSAQINKLKQEKEKNIQIFGSPGAVSSLMNENLIDDYWLFVAPVVLGKGIPLFTNISNRVNLKLVHNKVFRTGMIALHYQPVG